MHLSEKDNVTSLILKFIYLTGLVFLVSSCASTAPTNMTPTESNKLGLEPAPLPRYQVGTKFVYSNGTWETVAGVTNNEVEWINHRNNQSAGTADFTYKRSRWQTRDRHGQRQFSQADFILGEMTTTLWPLKPGNKTRYDEIGTWYTESGAERNYDNYWSCEVLGTEKVSVAAGDFDTWKITCKRYPNKFRSTSKTREYRTWYYAPSINHWVVEERDYNGYRENRRKELAAVLPDLSNYTNREGELVSIKKQFQNTLESAGRENTNIWKNSDNKLIVGITPKRAFRDVNGGICRQYEQVFTEAGTVYEYPGIACRNDKGRWIVPRR